MKILSNSINNTHSKIYWLVITTLLIKLTLLPFSQTINADAVSRIYASINWMENPTWLTSNIWAPFHFYIHGFGLMLWNNPVYTPKILTILFSVSTLIPFYFITKREFNEKGALIATVFLAISPILFHNSFLALSETPYLFFLTLTINCLSKGVRENSTLYILISGLAITIASGIRYEAWILIAIFSGMLFLLKRWKFIFLFNFTAALFPCYWLLSNWIETGDPLYSIQGTYHWNFDVMGNNNNLDFENYLRRIWFFPFSWVIAIGIPTGFITLKTIFNSYTKKLRNNLYILYSIPFWIMFLFYQYNAVKGALLLQHRYVGTLVVLSLPFIAIYFSELTSKKIKQAYIFGALTVLLSFVYNTAHIKPLPRLEEQSAVEIVKLIKENTSNKSCLILDFVGWDRTYYIALQSGLHQKNIVLTEGATNSEIPLKKINEKINESNHGILLLKKNSELSTNLNSLSLKTQEIFNNDEMILLRWEK